VRQTIQTCGLENSSGARPDYSTMVLLIDDKRLWRRLAPATSRPSRTSISTIAADPIDAIRVANEVKPTVILQDWLMPSIDGLDLLIFFRGPTCHGPETPIILLSSEENQRLRAERLRRCQ